MGLVEEKVRAQVRKGVLIQTKTLGLARSIQVTSSGVSPARAGPQAASYYSQLQSPPFPNVLENAEDYREEIDSKVSREE